MRIGDNILVTYLPDASNEKIARDNCLRGNSSLRGDDQQAGLLPSPGANRKNGPNRFRVLK